jgi:hypothetical protein
LLSRPINLFSQFQVDASRLDNMRVQLQGMALQLACLLHKMKVVQLEVDFDSKISIASIGSAVHV